MNCIGSSEIDSSLFLKPVWNLDASIDKKAMSSEKISDVVSLTAHLPAICSHIYETLGDQQCEATYQRCLKVDLESAGVKVAKEVEINLAYKGMVVGTQRADLVLTLSSGEKAVVEMKAVTDLGPSHSEQLCFYMKALKIHHGFLINMPHSDGFPDIEPIARFVLKGIVGVDSVKRLTPRLKPGSSSPKTVQIVHGEIETLIHDDEKREFLRERELALAQKPDIAITKAGLPCKICIEKGGRQNCRAHRDR